MSEITARQRIFLMAVRHGLLQLLAAIEDYLGIERSKRRVVTK